MWRKALLEQLAGADRTSDQAVEARATVNRAADELGNALLEVELDGRGHSPVFTPARRLRNHCQPG